MLINLRKTITRVSVIGSKIITEEEIEKKERVHN